MFPDYNIEKDIISYGYKHVVGVDESGRGTAVADVVAAAVYIPESALPELLGKVNDSKKLSAAKREALYETITRLCPYGIGQIDAATIDKINILEATKLAMMQALMQLSESLSSIDFIIVDGTVDLSNYTDTPTTKIIKGDNKSASIAAASILAKVHKDAIMEKLHDEHPIYNWKKNKGYLTKEHIEMINRYGVTKYHRLSFNKVGR